MSLQELEKLDQLLQKFYKQKQQKFIRLSAGTLVLLIATTATSSLISSLVFSGVTNIKAATYGWVQTDWSGGVDDSASANHTDNQTGWTKIYSKDSSVDFSTSGELSLTSTQVAITDTSDADFAATTMTNNSGGFYIANNTIQLKKQEGASCTVDEECLEKCVGGICASSWILGSCVGIRVYESNISGTRQWKNAETGCSTPQCYIDGGQEDRLVESNLVDFADYPARDACKIIAGRLPTVEELTCIYNNKSDYGTFASGLYWTANEAGSFSSYFVRFDNGVSAYTSKTTFYNVRCVRTE